MKETFPRNPKHVIMIVTLFKPPPSDGLAADDKGEGVRVAEGEEEEEEEEDEEEEDEEEEEEEDDEGQGNSCC